LAHQEPCKFLGRSWQQETQQTSERKAEHLQSGTPGALQISWNFGATNDPSALSNASPQPFHNHVVPLSHPLPSAAPANERSAHGHIAPVSVRLHCARTTAHWDDYSSTALAARVILKGGGVNGAVGLRAMPSIQDARDTRTCWDSHSLWTSTSPSSKLTIEHVRGIATPPPFSLDATSNAEHGVAPANTNATATAASAAPHGHRPRPILIFAERALTISRPIIKCMSAADHKAHYSFKQLWRGWGHCGQRCCGLLS
jgi:hypothetical protein